MCDANDQLLISNTVHHLDVGCKEVCQSVDPPTLELFFISVAMVLSDEPMSHSTLEIRAKRLIQLKILKHGVIFQTVVSNKYMEKKKLDAIK